MHLSQHFVLCSLFFVRDRLPRRAAVRAAAPASAVEAASGTDSAGFARAAAPRPFVFPRDHGAHTEYATEWWYYTGNLDTEDGQHFGFQLTFFRSALAPEAPARASAWATTNIYMAHFTLTNVAAGQFQAFERFSRSAAGLAGADRRALSRLARGLERRGQRPEGWPMRLRAAQDGTSIDLALTSQQPPLLQGERGLSQKSATPGNASYYYSLTHMATEGTIEAGGQRYTVRGLTWMDHEFGSSAIEPGAGGWDWFGLQLGDGRDLMYARVRNADGSSGFAFGALAEADGSKRDLSASEVTLEPLGTWRSPRTGAEYPAGWRLQVPAAAIDLRITPWLADQELALAVVYWEGAVRIEGSVGGEPVGGNGYVELTGYGERAQGELRLR